MRRVQLAFWTHLLVVVTALAIAYAMGQVLWMALVIVFLGGFWYYAQANGAQGLETILFFVFALAAAAGFWIGLNYWMLLIAIGAALGTWDLDHFLQRLRSVKRVDMETGLGRAHLRRLLLIEGLGLLAGLVGLTAHLKLSFWTDVLLVILAMVGIRQLVAMIKNQIE